MPDTYWISALAEAERQVTGPDPYRDGWSACMEWLARVPPADFKPEARELWFEGYDDALDSPLGSGPNDTAA